MAKSNRQLLITLGADTTTFSQKVKRAKDLTKELDSNFKLLSSSSKDFDKSLDGLAKKQDYLNDRIKVANTLNDVYNKRLADQQDRLNKSTESMKKLEKELEDLKQVQQRSLDTKEWQDWQKEIDKVEDELKQVTKETKGFQDNVISLHTAINKNQTEIQKMNGELSETKIKFEMLSRDKTFEEMKKDIVETDRQFENIKNSTDGFGKAVSDLKAEKAQLNIQMQKTNKLMEEYAKDIQKSTKEMDKLQKEVDRLTDEYNAMKKVVDSMDGTEKHYEEWANSLDKLGSELTSANRLLTIHKDRVKSLENSYNQSENSIKSMEGSIKRVDNEIYNFGRNNNFKSIETHMESLRHEFDLLGSRMDLLRSKYVNFENSMSGAIRESKLLKQQTKVLREEFKAQESAMNEYKLKLKDLTSEKTKLKAKIEELKKSLKGVDENSPTFVKTNSALGELERNLEKVEDEMQDVNKQLRQMELESNSTLTNINNNIQGQGRVWDVLSNKIQSAGSAFTNAGNAMQSLGGALMPVTVGVTALGGAVITTGMNFQEGMSKATAVMSDGKENMEDLISTARKLASESRWTATDVADAYNYMGMAGWNASQSLKGIEGVLNLATAGATDLATSSDIVTDGLTAMGLSASDTNMFVDAMSATMVRSNTNIEMMGETLKYAGNVAGGLGITMQDLSLAIGVMANAGIKGSMSGTALRGGLTRLIAPTEKATELMKKYGIEVKKTTVEENGMKKEVVDLRGTMENLRQTVGDLDVDTQSMVAKTIFGQTAMNGWLAIINADEQAFKDLGKAIDDASESNGEFTKRLAYEMNNNLAGDIRTFKSTLEESFLTIFDEIEPYLRKAVNKITLTIKDATEWFKGLDDATQKNIVKFVAFAGVIAPLVSAFGFLLSGVGTTITTFGKLVGISGNVITKFNLLKGSGVTLKGLFTNFNGTIKTLTSTMKGNLSGALSSVTKLFGGGAGLSGVLGSLSSVALPAVAVALAGMATIFGDNEQALSNLIDKFGWFGKALSGISEMVNGVFKGTVGQIGNLLGGISGTFGAIFKGEFREIDDIWSKTFSNMKNTASESWENITMTSTRSISKLRQYTEKDLGQIKTIFKNTYGQISKVTSANLEEVATNMTNMFADSRSKTLDLSSSTIDILRGTSDTMRILFTGIKSEMDIDVAKARFTENLHNLLNTGGTTAEQLAKDFENAWKTIDTNIVDGGQRLNKNASKILEEFGEIASGKIDQGVDDIVSILDDLDVRGVQSLRSVGTNWNAIFAGISTDSKMTTEEMKNAILANIERLGLDTPEKLQAFKDTLKYELDTVKTQTGEDGKEIGSELLDNIESGVNEGVESTGENIKNATKNVTEQATTGAKEGFEQLPDSVRQELEKAGVSINEQGNVIVTDMASKGREGAKAYIDEMNSELGNVSGVATTIQTQLDAIDSVRFGNVTKQLSEINKWLGNCTDSAVKMGASMTAIVSISFGGTTKGLSEVNKWLKDNITKSAKNTKTALQDITKITYNNTTKGLSEINKWLKDNITKSAKESKNALQNITTVNYSGTTKGLSEVNKNLKENSSNAITTKNALQNITTVSFGGTTKGLSEVNRWLKDNSNNAITAKNSLQNITTVSFGGTTKGLSEVNRWLKDNVTPRANSARTSLQNLANVRFSGLTSSLSSVVNMLNNITNKANSTKNAINRVITSNKRSAIPETVQLQQSNVVMPVFDALAETTADINKFKTTGGFYNPTSVVSNARTTEISGTNNTNELLKATLEQNQLLLQLLNQQKPLEVAVNMDGRQVAKASARYMESEINLINSRRNRLGGK